LRAAGSAFVETLLRNFGESENLMYRDKEIHPQRRAFSYLFSVVRDKYLRTDIQSLKATALCVRRLWLSRFIYVPHFVIGLNKVGASQVAWVVRGPSWENIPSCIRKWLHPKRVSFTCNPTRDRTVYIHVFCDQAS